MTATKTVITKAAAHKAPTSFDGAMKWLGIATLLFGVLPGLAIVLRDLPGAMRELKDIRMGWNGGWKQAH